MLVFMKKKNPHAVALGSLGGKAKAELPAEVQSKVNRAGGFARAAKLSKKRRVEIAKKAVAAREAKRAAERKDAK